MPKENNSLAKKDELGESAAREQEIDECVEESFQANDPPSWTLGTDRRKGISNPERES